MVATGKHKFESDFAKKFFEQGLEQGLEKGEQEGRAAMLFHLLERRGLHVSDAQRTQIADCADAATLERWFDRALDAESTQQVLEGS